MLLEEMLVARLEELDEAQGGGEDEEQQREVLLELLVETRANLEMLPELAKSRRVRRRASELQVQ
jgi:hypothetical protein